MALIQPLSSLLINGVHTLATCWEIERTDGFILRYTDHNVPLIFNNHTFLPIGGVSASARQKVEGLQRAQNLEIKGFVSADDITNDDLRAGRYREAKITEYLLNWNFPYSAFQTQTYWITDTIFDGETWSASIAGLIIFLRQRVGRLHERICAADLGDEDCGIDLSLYAQLGEVTAITTARRKFETDVTNQVDDWFALGVLTWTSGNNLNLTSEIKSSFQDDGVLEIQLKTPFDIEVGDEFSITPGCNKLPGISDTIGHCKNKFNNLANNMGDPYIPGTDALLTTPDVKQG